MVQGNSEPSPASSLKSKPEFASSLVLQTTGPAVPNSALSKHGGPKSHSLRDRAVRAGRNLLHISFRRLLLIQLPCKDTATVRAASPTLPPCCSPVPVWVPCCRSGKPGRCHIILSTPRKPLCPPTKTEHFPKELGLHQEEQSTTRYPHSSNSPAACPKCSCLRDTTLRKSLLSKPTVSQHRAIPQT